MAAHAPHLLDASNLSPEELAELRASQHRAEARRGQAQQIATVHELLPPAAKPVQPRLLAPLSTWLCPGCSQPYQAARCQDLCPDCRRKALEIALQNKRQQIRDNALKPAREDFGHVTLDHPQIGAWVKSPGALAKARERAELDYDETLGTWSFLLLLGGTGAGKTTLGTAVFRHLADRVLAPEATEADEDFVRGMVWIPAMELARSRRETPLGKSNTKVERALNATVLMLDDLGQEAPADKEDLVYVLTERQRYRRKTIVTCGFPLDSLEERYGAHLERRLTERAHVLNLGSPRGPKRSKAKKATSEKGAP